MIKSKKGWIEVEVVEEGSEEIEFDKLQKPKLSIGDYVFWKHFEKTSFGTIVKVWISENSYYIRISGTNKKVKVPFWEVKSAI